MLANMHGGRCALLLTTFMLTAVDGRIAKCTESKQHKVVMNCPADHVIYQPIIYLGSSRTGTCRYQDGDCTGLSNELEDLKDSCFWKSSCKLHWDNNTAMMSSKNVSCQLTKPTYIMYDSPTCIHNGNIIDIHSDDDDRLRSLSHGVIRSSRAYPRHYKDIRTTSRKVLAHRPGHVLVLCVDDLKTTANDNLRIYAGENHRQKQILYARDATDETYQIEGDAVHIVFTLGDADKSERGFIIRFEYIKDGISNNIKMKNHVSAIVRPKSNNHLNVKGSLDTCIIRRDAMRMICPADHVIFKPDVTTGVSNGRSCVAKPGDCQGLTHTLVTQINRCYWKGQCDLTWTRGVPLTMTNTLNCLAQYPSYISVRSYECIPQSEVFDICSNSYSLINSSRGIIRSHPLYPWHYPTREITCRKYISITKGQGLRIYTDEIDLDPDTKGDSLKFFELGKKTLIKKLIGGQRADITMTEGCLTLQFKVSKRSKGAAGFILRFEPANINSHVSMKNTNLTCSNMMTQRKSSSRQSVSDEGYKKKRRKSRRCGGKDGGMCRKGRTDISRKKNKKTDMAPSSREEGSKPMRKNIQNTEGRKRKKKGRGRNRGKKRRRGKGRRRFRKKGRKNKRGRKRNRKSRRSTYFNNYF